jgi:TetR/AcrR family transcriptional regulator, regulator of cefoperazone and chloramphenicol sensitivity
LKQAFGLEETMEVHDATKARLLEAAGEEFADKGFECARIRAICERAQANISAVNYHFGDKEQLYVQAVLEGHRCGLDSDEETHDESEEPADALRRFIHHFLCRVLALHNPNDWRHRLMLREMLQPTTASDVLIREAIRPRFERLIRILRRFCPDAEERKLQALAFSVIGQCLHYKMAGTIAERLVGARGMERLDHDYLTEHITTFCLAALGHVAPLNRSGESAPIETGARP